MASYLRLSFGALVAVAACDADVTPDTSGSTSSSSVSSSSTGEGGGASTTATATTASTTTASSGAGGGLTSTSGPQGGGPACSLGGSLACPAVGDTLALGGDVAWSLGVHYTAQTSIHGPTPSSLGCAGFDGLGRSYFVNGAVAGQSAQPCGVAATSRSVNRVDAAQELTQVAIPSNNEYVIDAVSPPGSVYTVDASSIAKLDPTGAFAWRQSTATGGMTAAGPRAVALCSQTDCSAFTSDGAPLWTRTVRAAPCPGAPGQPPPELPPPCSIAGVAVLPDGATAVSGNSPVSYDFGGGPITGPFLVILETDGSIRAQVHVASDEVGFASASDAGRIVVMTPGTTFVEGPTATVSSFDARGHRVQKVAAGPIFISAADGAGNPLWQQHAMIGSHFLTASGSHLYELDATGRVLVVNIDSGALERDVQITLPADVAPHSTGDDLTGITQASFAADGRLCLLAQSQPACTTGCAGHGGPNPSGSAYLIELGPLHCTP